MTKKKIDWRIVITGLICVTALEITALILGYNGTMLKIVLMIIAGGTGLVIKNPLETK